MRIPVATYRVQFNQDFRFADATAICSPPAPIGHQSLYTHRRSSRRDQDPPTAMMSSIRTGSIRSLDPTEDFDALVEALHSRGMGLLLDIVPNHMAASPENAWWMDVLENGPASPYASYFGINWGSSSDPLQDKIFLPILGDPYGRVLERGELTIAYEEGGFSLNYYAHKSARGAG